MSLKPYLLKTFARKLRRPLMCRVTSSVSSTEESRFVPSISLLLEDYVFPFSQHVWLVLACTTWLSVTRAMPCNQRGIFLDHLGFWWNWTAASGLIHCSLKRKVLGQPVTKKVNPNPRLSLSNRREREKKWPHSYLSSTLFSVALIFFSSCK